MVFSQTQSTEYISHGENEKRGLVSPFNSFCYLYQIFIRNICPYMHIWMESTQMFHVCMYSINIKYSQLLLNSLRTCLSLSLSLYKTLDFPFPNQSPLLFCLEETGVWRNKRKRKLLPLTKNIFLTLTNDSSNSSEHPFFLTDKLHVVHTSQEFKF